MRSRRPPLNLTEPKLKSQSKTGRGTVSEETTEDAAEDILDAPLTTAAAEDTAEVAGDFDIPETRADTKPEARAEPGLHFTPPPEVTPPARTTQAKTPKKTKDNESPRRDLSTLTVEPEGVMKATGTSPAIFWGAVTVVSLVPACALAAFILGAQGDIGAFALKPFNLVVVACLALFPVALIFASAFALRNVAALARQSQRTAALADAMLAPAASAATETAALVEALRSQVDHAVRAVRLAHADVTELSNKLKSETDRLQDAAQIARAATQAITRSLEHEREAIGQVSSSLSVQTTGIIETVDRQARMVADASDLAQTQLREAEASLASTASEMMNAASDVSDTARRVSEDLDRQTQRLETAGSGVSDQIRSVEEGLSQQRAGLVSAALSLRADQEDFAVHIENQRAQLTEALSITRVATVDLGETSARGIDVLRDIVLSAQENFSALNGAAENERTAFETRIHATLSNISIMAADARDDLIDETRRSLEQLTVAAADAKRAADLAAQTAQARVDRLNETIFEASKKADEVFDSRFNAARRLIEDSAELINEAGDQTAEKLDQSFAHTRQTINEVNQALNELTQSADQLPLMAQDRLHDIRKAVEDGLAAMTAAAKKATLETEAVDLAFQDRVKRNYEMLNEAVRLMGVISGEAPLSSQATAGADTFRDRDYGRTIATPRPAPQPPQAMPRPVQTSAPAPRQTSDARLRLSPLGTETRPSPGPQPTAQPTVQPARPTAPQKTPDGWSWRDLLNGMEGGQQNVAEAPNVRTYEPPVEAQPPFDAEFDSLDAVMINEVNAMGVDAAALLSRGRIEETVSAIMAEDNEGARMVIRRVAPAAIRRLARRLVSDVNLRQQANDFATFYDQQINIALMSKDPSRALTEILANDTGRAYLLLDAAISDLI